MAVHTCSIESENIKTSPSISLDPSTSLCPLIMVAMWTLTSFFLYGSSQLVIGKKVTNNFNIMNIVTNAFQLLIYGHTDNISPYDYNFLSYIELSTFTCTDIPQTH